MEFSNLYLQLLVAPIIIFIFFVFLKTLNNHNELNTPPSPPSLPILGHLHLLLSIKGPIHQHLRSFSSSKYVLLFRGLKGLKVSEMGIYRFIPFGVGRRSCPGAALGMRFVGLSLWALIQCFDWETVGSGGDDLNVAMGGVNLLKGKPLEAMCAPRNSMASIISQL